MQLQIYKLAIIKDSKYLYKYSPQLYALFSTYSPFKVIPTSSKQFEPILEATFKLSKVIITINFALSTRFYLFLNKQLAKGKLFTTFYFFPFTPSSITLHLAILIIMKRNQQLLL